MPKGQIVQIDVCFYILTDLKKVFAKPFVVLDERLFLNEKAKRKNPSKATTEKLFGKIRLLFLNKGEEKFFEAVKFEKRRKTEYNSGRKEKRRRKFWQTRKNSP